MTYALRRTSKFKKDYRRMERRGNDMEKIDDVIRLLAAGEALPDQYRDHALAGGWRGYRECHIEPDWLLVYKIENSILVLTLTETGAPSDLFG
jgi:mRNA interferase YafQ